MVMHVNLDLLIHADGTRGMAIVISCVRDYVCLSVCLHSKNKKARAINSNVGKHIVRRVSSVCIDPEVEKSKDDGHRVIKSAAGF